MALSRPGTDKSRPHYACQYSVANPRNGVAGHYVYDLQVADGAGKHWNNLHPQLRDQGSIHL